MHSCLTLSNVGGHWYVEREVSGLLSSLKGYCDSIHSCDISIEGPGGEDAARCWRVELRLRVLDQIVRAMTRAPAGTDPQQSLQHALADIYARARKQLDHIAEQHHASCAHGGQSSAPRLEASA